MSQRIEFPQSGCRAGVATVDITPPVGIYHRMWGAARHDRSTGIHRPLTATVLALAPIAATDVARQATLFIGVDHCLLRKREMDDVLTTIAARSAAPIENVVVFFSHTHAAGLMGYERQSLPGGELIPPYLAEMSEKIGDAAQQALADCRPARIVYGTGDCRLGRNRDFLDPQRQEYVCGFHPEGPADSTVLIARVSDAATGATLLSVVNYACHPTTLAWQNTLISPDYVGAMREVVSAVTQAPCLYVHGAAGDIGPRDGFVGDVEVADRNGRELGHAALAALTALPAPLVHYEYAGQVVSGATIGEWKYRPVDDARRAELVRFEQSRAVAALPYHPDLPRREDLQRERAASVREEAAARAAGDEDRAATLRALIERADRGLARIEHLPAGESFPFPLRLWRIGDAVWIALDGEHYNLLQRELRSRYPGTPLIIGTIANGSQSSYLLDAASYGKGLYQEKVAVLGQGALEKVIAALDREIEQLMGPPRA